MGKEPEKLDSGTIKRIDGWIVRQFALKNRSISKEASGIILVDRCPLDPVSFTPVDERRDKASYLLTEILKLSNEIVPGHIILLLDDPSVLELRLISGPKEYTSDRLDELQEDIKTIYNMPGVSKIDAKYMNTNEIIKKVAKIIHTETYLEIDVKKELEKIQKGEAECLQKKD